MYAYITHLYVPSFAVITCLFEKELAMQKSSMAINEDPNIPFDDIISVANFQNDIIVSTEPQ